MDNKTNNRDKNDLEKWFKGRCIEFLYDNRDKDFGVYENSKGTVPLQVFYIEIGKEVGIPLETCEKWLDELYREYGLLSQFTHTLDEGPVIKAYTFMPTKRKTLTQKELEELRAKEGARD